MTESSDPKKKGAAGKTPGGPDENDILFYWMVKVFVTVPM